MAEWGALLIFGAVCVEGLLISVVAEVSNYTLGGGPPTYDDKGCYFTSFVV